MTLNLENPFNLTGEEFLLGAIFGPIPEIVQKMQHGLDSFSDEDAFEYGKHAARQYIEMAEFYSKSVKELLQRGESFGLKFPQPVKAGFVVEFMNEPRLTFKEALERIAAERVNRAEVATRLADDHRALVAAVSDEALYRAGYDYGKECLTGWNSAQYDADQTIQLLEAELGMDLNEHLEAGIRDAYAHRETVAV